MKLFFYCYIIIFYNLNLHSLIVKLIKLVGIYNTGNYIIINK